MGAALHPDDGGYGGKVLAEYARLKEVAAGRSVPLFTPPALRTVEPAPAPAVEPAPAV